MSCDHVIQTMITPVRKGKNTGAPGVNVTNLVPLGDKKRWTIPGILTPNARSLSAEMSDELLTAANLNDVSCVCRRHSLRTIYIYIYIIRFSGHLLTRGDHKVSPAKWPLLR